MHRNVWRVALVACVLTAGSGCAARKVWVARQTAVISQMKVPECACVDPKSGAVYVSNMDTATQDYWADDGAASISVLRARGDPFAMRWKESKPDAPLHSPKGMCVLHGILYVADNTRVVAYPVLNDVEPSSFLGPTGRHLNDVATDGVAVYVSDTDAGVVYRMDSEGVTHLKAPEGVNGITFFKGKMFAVSWTRHEVYELDPTGKDDPVPFGLAEHFQTPDGIEVLEDGTFLVADLKGNRVAAISPDRRTVRTLIDLKTPADIGLDMVRRLLYVPQFEENCVAVYRLTHEEK